jgi:hypothetical protein
MTFAARPFVSQPSRLFGVLVQNPRKHKEFATVVFRGAAQKYSVRPGHPYFGEDAAPTRFVEYKRALAKKLGRPLQPSEDVRGKGLAGGRLQVERLGVH